jgi:hypothetical protein
LQAPLSKRFLRDVRNTDGPRELHENKEWKAH